MKTMGLCIRHPRIYLDCHGRYTHALALEHGRVVAIGDAALEEAGNQFQLIEPDAACVMPALGDAHVHLWGLGLRRGSISLRNATSCHAVYETLRKGIAEQDSGWIFGRDFNDRLWTDAPALSAPRLDALSAGRPMCLRRVDGHALWVNQVALTRAGLDRGSLDFGEGGRVALDGHGKPTGLLVDDAMTPILNLLPERTVDEDRQTALESMRMFRRYGIAWVHVAWAEVDRIEMLEELRHSNALPIRLSVFADGRDSDLGSLMAVGPKTDRDDKLDVRGIKFFADGALGSEGALMLDAYRGGGHGLEVESAAELKRAIKPLVEGGWQIAVHAIGDRATTNVLDAFESLDTARRSLTRCRIEHAQTVTDNDINRFGKLDVLASIQPIHMRSDAVWAADSLSEEQLKRLFRWKDLGMHTHLCSGSDYPIEDPNPWHGLSTALSRLDANGRPFQEKQALSRHQALASYTTGVAYAGHREDRWGKLDIGFQADAIAVDTDPFLDTPQQIWSTQVLRMWISGSEVSQL